MIPEAWAVLLRVLLASLAAAALFALGRSGDSLAVMVLGPLVVTGVLAFAVRRPLAAYRAARKPLDPEVIAALRRHVPHFNGLDARGQEAFVRRVMRMLATIEFERVQDARDTLELRVLAVAGAALLYVGRDDLHIDEHRSVIFYPDAFSHEYAVEHDARIAGMVHRQGPVLFSEQALRDGWNHDSDGYNVSVHEWAHVLDLEDGFADGIPGLASGSLAEEQVLLNSELVRARGGRTVLRDYAGTNRAELFAVATEVFFERPELLRRSHSRLYGVLAAWLRVEPIELLRRAGVPPTPQRPVTAKRPSKRKGGKKPRAR